MTDDLDRELLQRIGDDYTGVWEIVRIVGRLHPQDSDEARRLRVVEAIGRLCRAGTIVLGDLHENGEFEPWSEAVEQALARLDAGWKALGRDPDVGELVWLNTSGDRQ